MSTVEEPELPDPDEIEHPDETPDEEPPEE